jgi:hypothetical protein
MQTNNLESWLSDPKAAKFLGRAAAIKIEVLAALVDGRDTLPMIAARHHVSRQAVDRYQQRARKIFFDEQENVAAVD